MIRESAILFNLILVISLCVSKDPRDNIFPAENGEISGNGPASPVLLMLSEMMNKNSDSAKSASLKELQKKVESDRSNIQKIPRRNQEKLALEEKRRELEEKQRELEENFVLSPDYDKYSYKSIKRPSISFSVGARCELATCYRDGKPFMNIHNYCNNGITDLQSACEQKYLSVRHRRGFTGEGSVIPDTQTHNLTSVSGGTCVIGTTWKEDCNTCYCITAAIPACTRMACPPKEKGHENAPGVKPMVVKSTGNEKYKRDTKELFKRLSADDEPQDAPFDPKQLPNSINHECTPNSQWQEDCNTCFCTEDGLGKFCTTDMCMEENAQAVTAPLPCMPGNSWKEDCNDCFCTFVGAPSCSLVSC